MTDQRVQIFGQTAHRDSEHSFSFWRPRNWKCYEIEDQYGVAYYPEEDPRTGFYVLVRDLSDGLEQDILEHARARVLGEVVYSQGRCKPGFGLIEFADWASVYAAAPNIPASVLRGVARYAGVHLYNHAGDVLYASRQLLGVHTVAGGSREFALPEEAEVVYDLFERRVVARDADHFSVILPPRSTALYYTGERDLLTKLDQL